MSDFSDMDSSGLSEGWAVVNDKGELEDRESDSSSSSIEVLDQKAEDEHGTEEASSHSDSAECIELEKLMKDADAAAANSTAEAGLEDSGRCEPVTSKTVVAPGVSITGHLFDPAPLLGLSESSGASELRSGSSREDDAKARTVLTQPSPDRASSTDQASVTEQVFLKGEASQSDEAFHSDRSCVTDQASFTDRASVTDRAFHRDEASDRDEASHEDRACQTDRASPVLSESRFSLTSLWSVSSKSSSSGSVSSSTDTSSDGEAGSVSSIEDRHPEGHGLSSDTDIDTDSEFVCLETEASSSNCPQLLEGSVSRSEVETRHSGSRSSMMSDFWFLPGSEDVEQSTVNTSLKSFTLVASEQTREQQQYQQQQPQQQQQSQQQLHGAWEPQESLLPEEQGPPAVLPDQEEIPGEQELLEAASSALQHLPPQQQSQQGGEDSQQQTDSLHSQDLSKEDNIPAALLVEPECVWNHRSVSSIERWLIKHLYLTLGALLMLMLAFLLGHWQGVAVGQSKLADSQLSHMEELRRARDNHRDCMSQRQVIYQQAQAALERVRQLQEKNMTKVRGKEAQHQKKSLHPPGKTLHADRAHPSDGQEGRQPVTPSWEEEPVCSKENLDNEHKESDSMRHLYFSMRDEREIKMNASSYLDYLTQSVNLSAIRKRLGAYWDASMKWNESTEVVSSWLGAGVSMLQRAVTNTVSLVWKGSDRKEGETYTRKRHQKKWSDIMHKFFKKAQKKFSHFGRQLQNWYKVKHSCPLWSEDSAISRVAAQMKNSIIRFSSVLKVQATQWFGKNFRQQKDPEEFHRTIDENDGVYVDYEDFDEKLQYDWGVEGEEEHEEINEGNHAWTEEESEYIETDGNDHTRKEFSEKTQTEEDSDKSDRRHKKWSGVLSRFLKTTQKAFFGLGHRLEKTWHMIKPTSWPLWSENSPVSRMAARMKKKIDKFSAKLQKKADRWFRKRFKGKTDSEVLQKHAKKSTHGGNGEEGKTPDLLNDNNEHAMHTEEHKRRKKDQQSKKSGKKIHVKYRPDGSDSNADVLSDNFNKKGMKEATSDKLRKGKKSEHSNKPNKKDRNGKHSNQSKEHWHVDKGRNSKKGEGSEKLSLNGTKEERTLPQNKAKQEKDNKMAKAKDKRAESDWNNQKQQRGKSKKSGKPHEKEKKRRERGKLDDSHFEQHEDSGHKDGFQAQNLRETPPQQHGEKREHRAKSSSRETKHNGMARGRAKFRLQSQFQRVFSKVSVMDTETFRDWSRRDLSEMAEEVLTMAELYSDNLYLGLPVSGSQWLGCQHAFWLAASLHGMLYEPTQKCWQFLAPWQLALLEEEAEESSRREWTHGDAEDVGEDDWDSWTYADHDDIQEDADVHADDEYAFADDCRVRPNTNDDDSNDVSADGGDDLIDHGHVYSYNEGGADHPKHYDHPPKGQREGDEDSNSPAESATDSWQQPSRQTNHPWYTHRAQGRSRFRAEDHKADWIFERAWEREDTRQQEHAADWVFERAAERDASRHKKGEDGVGERKQEAEKHSQGENGHKVHKHSQGKNQQKSDNRGRSQQAGSRYRGR